MTYWNHSITILKDRLRLSLNFLSSRNLIPLLPQICLNLQWKYKYENRLKLMFLNLLECLLWWIHYEEWTLFNHLLLCFLLFIINQSLKVILLNCHENNLWTQSLSLAHQNLISHMDGLLKLISKFEKRNNFLVHHSLLTKRSRL